MRSSFVLFVLLLAASLFTAPVLAGNVEDCEDLKGATKGLYGLCIAYHNADSDEARQKILDNYDKKAGAGDPPMPGTGAELDCPCFGADELAEAGLYHDPFECVVSADPDAGFELAFYEDDATPVNFRVEGNTGGGFANSCFYIHDLAHDEFGTAANLQFGITAQQVLDCRSLVETAIAMDFETGEVDEILCEVTP